MEIEKDVNNTLVIDIQQEYINCRTSGYSRNEAISIIKDRYSNELLDEDDRIFILIGLGLALSKKKEMTRQIAQEIHICLNGQSSKDLSHKENTLYLPLIERVLADEQVYGNEADYKRRIPYIPNWIKGDLFAHALTHPNAKDLGIEGWTILFYKVGEYIDDYLRHHQLMYIAVCPPGCEPRSRLELESLEFLRVMCHGDKWDYLIQFAPKNKQDELAYGLLRIGNYPEISLPEDRTDENPLVAMPIYGKLRKTDLYPDFEEHICRMYKRLRKGTAI